jgi:hypothetical protein
MFWKSADSNKSHTALHPSKTAFFAANTFCINVHFTNTSLHLCLTWEKKTSKSNPVIYFYSVLQCFTSGKYRPWGGAVRLHREVLRGKGVEMSLEVGPSKHTVLLFTIEVTSNQTLENHHHFIKSINHAIKNSITMK